MTDLATSDEDAPVIDFGAHMHPEAVISDRRKNRPFAELTGDLEWNPETRVEWMADSDVDEAVLSAPDPMGTADHEMARRSNDALLEVVREYDCFYGLASLPVAAGGETAAEEFERCLDAGFHGGALETKTDGIELVDEEVEPVLEVADRTGAPVMVHPKIDESLHPEALDSHRLNAIFGREVGLAESISKVIHNGILDRYPDLDLVYHHTGGNIAGMMGRIHLELDEGRWPEGDTHVYLDEEHEGGRVKYFSEFKEQLEDRIFIDTSGFFGYHEPLRASLEELPATQILFGTDAPYEPRTPEELDDMVETVRDLAPRQTERRILGTNCLDILVNVDS